ncbi:hypothetical protein ISN44_As10g017290 [Arabidopsis suecica]|uniref:Uncharacterized protein n=1 Tax=Arabidopsis suecica TaxID=45249 RepID=A0A8T1ZYD3_ARASU|nr:hypothetical protein ISN44_As10g017290 [Arabidopsis suecica]
MALRRTLSLRSLFSASCYKPSCSSIIHREQKLNYDTFLHQRSFTSSMILSQQHLMRSSSHLPLCTPFGVSIYHRSMSTSRFTGSDLNKNYSVLQDVASKTKVVDAVHQFVDKVHSFTGFNWWISLVLTALLLPLVTSLLIFITSLSRIMIYYLIMKTLLRLARVCLDIKNQGGDVTVVATSHKEFDNPVTEYGGEDIINCSTSAFSLARNVLQPWLYPWVGITEKIASFTVDSAFSPDLASPYALRMFPVLPVFHFLIGLECFGILSIVGFTTLGKRVPEARIFARFLAWSFWEWFCLRLHNAISRLARCSPLRLCSCFYGAFECGSSIC